MFKINQKGVTMMMLVITIIVLIMLTYIAVFYSSNVAPEARIAAAYNSLKEIKKACMEAETSIELRPDLYDEYDFFGKTIFEDGSNTQDLAKRCGLSSDSEFGPRTYKFTPDKDEDVMRRLQALELSSISRSYVVDLGTSGGIGSKYYVVDGVKRKNDVILYEFKDIEGLYEMLTE